MLGRRIEKMEAVHVSKWLVIFSNCEFVVVAASLLDAKREVQKQIPVHGLKRGQKFEIYRLGGAAAYDTI